MSPSPRASVKEARFYRSLRDVFVGAEVEGESGYINLMAIKSRYYEDGVFPKLKQDIEKALEQFPEFRDELFDKLYTFFSRYFSESGSIYFSFTPLHQNVYERVYTDDRDVMLFWKTHMLYYVKTDRLFRNLEVELDGFKFFFDVSTLEHKKAMEKREIVHEFKTKRKDGALVFSVSYSERGKKTKMDEILREYRKQGVVVSEDTLERAFQVFAKQSEVDYFINKNAKAFLQEQFNLWLYQYVFAGESEWAETRIKQLQTLKDIAFKIIDFISQFEDELVKIWNKPKFVLNSNYVITLDRIAERDMGLVERLLAHQGFQAQVEEWQQLGIIGGSFRRDDVVESNLMGKQLNDKYRHLPIDTRYFKDLELEILGLFENLDEALDGWLIKSENYQALNTILPKFREKVQTIFIDPPFNKEKEADYYYSVKYKDATWITILENRLRLARSILKGTGSIFVRCDYNGNMLVRLLMSQIFGEENFRNEILVRRGAESIAGLSEQFEKIKSMNTIYDNLYWYSRNGDVRFDKILRPASETQQSAYWHSFWKSYDRPNLRYLLLGIEPDSGQWLWAPEIANEAVENYKRYLDEYEKTGIELTEYWERSGKNLKFIRREGNSNSVHSVKYWVAPREFALTDNNWLEIPGYSSRWRFKTENSETLLKRCVEYITPFSELVMDFFLGSGTTIAVGHKLKRKWLGVEMGEHYYTVILPRMKEVLAGEKSGISKEVDWQGGGFFKYYELEQYEDTLRKAKYEDADLFEDPYRDPYNQYVFLRDLKMLEALEVDLEQDEVKVDPSKLYDNIDIAETLSNLRGKWIKKITPDPSAPLRASSVEFEDGEIVDIKNLDYRLIKPLIWW
jgi:adenine specific DNA methylase Mod